MANWSSTNDTCDPLDAFLHTFGHPASISCALGGIFLNVIIILVLLYAMKWRLTVAQIHLLALAFSDLAYVICCSLLAIVSWFCDPFHQIGRCITVFRVARISWTVTSYTNRGLTLIITGLRARAIKSPFQQEQERRNKSRCQMWTELVGYTVAFFGIIAAAAELVQYSLIQHGADPYQTKMQIYIALHCFVIVFMLSLAAYILVKVRRDGSNISNAEADFQRMVALVAIVFSLTHGVSLATMVVFRKMLPPQWLWVAVATILNSSVNFFIYMVASQHFKNAFWSWWDSCRETGASTDATNGSDSEAYTQEH